MEVNLCQLKNIENMIKVKVFLTVGVILAMTTASFGQTLKDFTIGEKAEYNFKQICTVARINGVVEALMLEDKTVYGITFMASDDGRNLTPIHQSDITGLIQAVEIIYDVEMEVAAWEEKIFTIHKGKNKSTLFGVIVACEEFSNDSCLMVFYMMDIALSETNEQEILNDIISDFQ